MTLGLLAAGTVEGVLGSLLADEETRRAWKANASKLNIERWLLVEHQHLERLVMKSSGLAKTLSEPGGLVKGMASMASFDVEGMERLMAPDDGKAPSPKLISQFIAIERSTVSQLVFGRSLASLIKGAREGVLEDLSNAVKVFPGVLGFKCISPVLMAAAVAQEPEIFTRLSTALRHPLKGIKQFELTLQHALSLMKRAKVIDRLDETTAAFIFLECEPALYPRDGEDPLGSLMRRIRRFRQEGRTIDAQDLSSSVF